MIRIVLMMVVLILVVGFCLFQFKYRVVSLEADLRVMEEIILEKQQNLRLLEAEWEHVTTPARIQALAQKHLSVAPLKASSYIYVSQIPFRDDDHILDLVQASLVPTELKSLSRHTLSMKSMQSKKSHSSYSPLTASRSR